jgi:glycosyltransferase involved in cell wall biosynthesis
MKDVKVSVISAIYNTDFRLVQRAVASLHRQDFRDFEVILVDDGSDRELGKKLIGLAADYQGMITLIRHSNRGQAASINRAIQISSGKYITILDADDEYKPDHLGTCLKEMAHFDLIASNAETVVDGEEDYYIPDRKNNDQLIHVDDCILFATLFGKREVFTDIEFGGDYGADAAFFEQASQHYRVAKLDLRTYVYYRNVPGSITSTIKVSGEQMGS